MVTTESHQSQELIVPSPGEGAVGQPGPDGPGSPGALALAGLALDPGTLSGLSLDPDSVPQSGVNAITVLTLLDKLVHMLDSVQDNQNKMEGHQVEMEGVVMGIQADMTKLSKSHSHTANTVSKLLDKSRKLSVTMKEVRDKMERQGAQVKKLEANHAHLVNRNGFKVLIFQEETEIPSTVFLKDPPPFPRENLLEEEEMVGSQEGGLSTIDLSSDEDVGLEAEPETEEAWPHDLENMEKSRAEKLKHSGLKKVGSIKKAFSKQNLEKKMQNSRHNIEKKMNQIGTKMVSMEQREKIKQRTQSLKVSPLGFSIRKPRSSSDSQPPEAVVMVTDIQEEEGPVAEVESQIQLSSLGSHDLDQEGGSIPEAQPDIQLSSLGSSEQDAPLELHVPFTEVHAQLAPGGPGEGLKQEVEGEGEGLKQEVEVEADVSRDVDEDLSEGLSHEYALSSTLPQDGEDH